MHHGPWLELQIVRQVAAAGTVLHVLVQRQYLSVHDSGALRKGRLFRNSCLIWKNATGQRSFACGGRSRSSEFCRRLGSSSLVHHERCWQLTLIQHLPSHEDSIILLGVDEAHPASRIMVVLGSGRGGRRPFVLLAVGTSLALLLESKKLGSELGRKPLALAKVIKLHVTHGMVDATDTSGVANGPLGSITRGEVATVNATEADLV
jgi:hypothetical protein